MGVVQLQKNTTDENIEYARLDDGALSVALLTHDEAAWREFVRRYEPVLRHQVGRVLGRAVRQVLDSDAIDDVIGDFYADILDDNMRKLRIWIDGPRIAQLGSWLAMIASQIAVEHIRRAFTERGSRAIATDDDVRDDDPTRGAGWIEAERVERYTEPEILDLTQLPRTRHRLSNDDVDHDPS
jgi:hypothetical protein